MFIRFVIGLLGMGGLFLAAYRTSWTVAALAVVVLCIAIVPRQVHRVTDAASSRHLR